MNRLSEDQRRSMARLHIPEVLYLEEYLRTADFELDRHGAAARAWCIGKAREGDIQASYVAAVLTALGVFGPVDEATSLDLCSAAAKARFPPAVALLGSFYENGWAGLPANREKALELMLKAGELGHAPGFHNAALLQLYSGHREHGLELLTRACALDYAPAQYAYANELLEHGGSEEVAIKFMTRAAEQDYSGAHRLLGYFFGAGRHGLPRDEAKSRYHFSRANELEDQAGRR